MPEINEIDSNFEFKSSMNKDGIRWISADSEIFTIFGLIRDEKGYKRMDSDVAKNTSEGVYLLHRMTSGGRISFETNSPYVAVNIKAELSPLAHMTYMCKFGFDLYIGIDEGFKYYRSFVPPVNRTDGYESIIEFKESGMKKILIHFPLYNDVNELHIGLDDKAIVNKLNPY